MVLAAMGGAGTVWSGLVYFLMGPAHFVNGYLWGRGAERLYAKMGHEA
jgi:hypothetical protein